MSHEPYTATSVAPEDGIGHPSRHSVAKDIKGWKIRKLKNMKSHPMEQRPIAPSFKTVPLSKTRISVRRNTEGKIFVDLTDYFKSSEERHLSLKRWRHLMKLLPTIEKSIRVLEEKNRTDE